MSGSYAEKVQNYQKGFLKVRNDTYAEKYIGRS